MREKKNNEIKALSTRLRMSQKDYLFVPHNQI